jgi:hypothetical protein
LGLKEEVNHVGASPPSSRRSRFWFADREQKRVTLAGISHKPRFFWGGMSAEQI